MYIKAETFQKLMEYKVNDRKIRRHAWPDEPLFDAPSDNALTQRVIGFFKAKGLRVQTHDFRKTFLTNLYNKGHDIVQVKEFVGHSSVKVTERYIQADKEKAIAAAAGLLDDM